MSFAKGVSRRQSMFPDFYISIFRRWGTPSYTSICERAEIISDVCVLTEKVLVGSDFSNLVLCSKIKNKNVRISIHRIEKNIFLRYNETNWIQFNSAVVTHTPKETKKWLYGTTNFGRFSLTRK